MSLRLYLDDCIDSKLLFTLLHADGHAVIRPHAAGRAGKPDHEHFAYARAQELILITRNPRDFERLHKQDQQHAGIFAIYQDNDPSRDMLPGDIVRAIRKVLEAGVPIAGQFVILNHWRY